MPKRRMHNTLLVVFLVIASFLIGFVAVFDPELSEVKLPLPSLHVHAQTDNTPSGGWINNYVAEPKFTLKSLFVVSLQTNLTHDS